MINYVQLILIFHRIMWFGQGCRMRATIEKIDGGVGFCSKESWYLNKYNPKYVEVNEQRKIYLSNNEKRNKKNIYQSKIDW